MHTPSESHAILNVLYTIFRAMNLLPGRSSSASEQARHGSLIRPCATALVFHVLWALERYPHLFPDLRDRAPALRERQERADHWLDLELLGQGLSSYARQNYLREQSEAVTESKEIIEQVRLAARVAPLLPGIDHDPRLIKIFPALRALLRQRESEVRARQLKAAGKSPKAPTANNNQQARARKKADANASLLGIFADLLRPGSRG